MFHVTDNKSRIAIIRDGYNFGDTTPAIKYNMEDHLGSSLILLDNVGGDVNYEEYFAFGETSFGSYALKRYKYCGKEWDNESGLYYYGARYYAGWTCRFISVDPLAADYPFYTPYNYAGNKPINKIDIDGMQENGAATAPTNTAQAQSTEKTQTNPPPIKVHLILYGAGYLNTTYEGADHDQGDSFKKSAEALKAKIENSPTFDPSKERVEVVYAPSAERFTEAINSQESGSIADVTVFSHGYAYGTTTNAGGLSLGGEKAGEQRPDKTIVTAQEAKDQLKNHDLREINANTLSKIDASKFAQNAVMTAYGCYVGGAPGWTNDQVESFSIANRLAIHLKIEVKAFTGSGMFKTNDGTMQGKPVIDGTMIRAQDVNLKPQRTRLSSFFPDKPPLIKR